MGFELVLGTVFSLYHKHVKGEIACMHYDKIGGVDVNKWGDQEINSIQV